MSLDQETLDKVRKLVIMFWGENVANNINYNDEVVEVVRQANEAMGGCNAIIHTTFLTLATGSAGASIIYSRPWLLDVAYDLLKLVDDNKRGWQACINVSAANYRSPLEMASMGI
nr:hypothetical protein [Pseudomonas sp.]